MEVQDIDFVFGIGGNDKKIHKFREKKGERV